MEVWHVTLPPGLKIEQIPHLPPIKAGIDFSYSLAFRNSIFLWWFKIRVRYQNNLTGILKSLIDHLMVGNLGVIDVIQ